MLRVSFCLNAGPKQGQAQSAVLVEPRATALLQAAANKLRLKKSAVKAARLFVWGSGAELKMDGGDLAGSVRNGDVISVSFGEEYHGPCRSRAAEGRDSSAVHSGASESTVPQGTPLVISTVVEAEASRQADTLGRETGVDQMLGARWHALCDSLAVVEWSDVRTMNDCLGRMRCVAMFQLSYAGLLLSLA